MIDTSIREIVREYRDHVVQMAVRRYLECKRLKPSLEEEKK